MASANVHSHTKAYIVRYLAPTVASSTLTANDLSHKVNKGNLFLHNWVNVRPTNQH